MTVVKCDENRTGDLESVSQTALIFEKPQGTKTHRRLPVGISIKHHSFLEIGKSPAIIALITRSLWG